MEDEKTQAVALLKKLMATKQGKEAVESAMTETLESVEPVGRDKLYEMLEFEMERRLRRLDHRICELVCDLVGNGEALMGVCDRIRVGYVSMVRAMYRFAPVAYSQAVEVRETFRRECLIKRLFDMATADVTDALDADGNVLPPSEIPENVRGSIESYSEDGKGKKIKMAPKTPNIKLLGQHLGLFNRDNSKDRGAVGLDDIFQKLEEMDRANSPKPITWEATEGEG